MFDPRLASAVRCAVLAALLSIFGTHIRAAADPAPKVHDGASAPGKAWDAAMQAGDLAALARMHDAATVSYPPEQAQVKGADAIMKDYADLFAKYTVTVKSEDAHWIEQPPLVVSWGLTTMTLRPRAGGPDVVSRTRFTDAAIRTATGWRYLIDHASVPAGR